ncbi:MAG: DNA polymerase III subunit gamma/tau [Aestuariivirgaceae bacterium]
MSELTPLEAVGYRVLARKYRPKTFADLIGQDAMVTTLTNAFLTGRIAQAYMLTGVRGVGKTTTARLIARALNYSIAGVGEPRVDMAAVGDHCEAILESRHPDVIEMDAASRTGIDDIREIIEQVRYAPVTARYKVYIIDEVHMLSKQAFNALLKTLEEPPPHVKFVFATTEIRKVPVTVLSRCQRFDLRRLDAELLIAHLGKVAASEGVSAEPESLRLIARAAEGSVRDGLSLLDQVISFGGGTVTARSVSEMLGLSDREKVVDMFDAVMRGDAATAIRLVENQHAHGGDAAALLTDLAEFIHLVTRFKVVPDLGSDQALSEAEISRGRELAEKLGMPALTRGWQMILKGLEEVETAPDPLMAAEMVLIRLAYASTLPAPAELVRRLVDGSATSGEAAPMPAASPRPSPEPPRPRNEESVPPSAVAAPEVVAITSFADIVATAVSRRDIKLKLELERHARPIRIEPGVVELALEPGAPTGLPGALSQALEAWTGRRWMVLVASSGGAKPLAQQAHDRREGLLRVARQDPAVQQVMARFPDAEILEVKEPPAAAETGGETVEEAGPLAD